MSNLHAQNSTCQASCHETRLLALQVDSPGAADAQHFYLHPSVSYWTDMATNFASWYSPQKGIK
jgi:hypothetical protein